MATSFDFGDKVDSTRRRRSLLTSAMLLLGISVAIWSTYTGKRLQRRNTPISTVVQVVSGGSKKGSKPEDLQALDTMPVANAPEISDLFPHEDILNRIAQERSDEDQMRALFDKEPRDEAWATTLESEIAEKLGTYSEESGNKNTGSVHCKSTLCEISIASVSGLSTPVISERKTWINDIQAANTTVESMFFRADHNGGIQTIIYLKR